MAFKINNSGTDDFEVTNDGVTKTNGLSFKTRYESTADIETFNLSVNEHFIVANSALGRTGSGDLTFILPDAAGDGVYDGQEIIIRTLNIFNAIKVQCSTDGIRQIGSSSVTTATINLSANQSYHYVYSSSLGYWVQTK